MQEKFESGTHRADAPEAGMRTRSLLLTAATLLFLAACKGGGGADRSEMQGAPEMPPTAVRVIDGDTVDVDGIRHRLAGLDAPERYQTCIDAAGVTWACGRAASERIEELIGAGRVTCSGSSEDRYGRSVSSCSVGGADLGQMLVRAGLALNDPRYGPDYSAAEDEARASNADMHAGRFIPPWSWRAGARLTPLSPSILAFDALVFVSGVPTPAATSCDPATCTIEVAGASITLPVAKLLPSDRPDAPISSLTVAGNGSVFAGLGYWLQESGFAIVSGAAAPVDEILMAVSSAEHFPATDPRPLDGGAVWRGFMLAFDTDAATTAVLSGSATITLRDFDDPSVDILFDAIREADTDEARPDMAWRGIAVRNGAFASGQTGDRISGRFYGDIQQEAGGVFERDGITGAFGAKRDRAK